MFVQFLGFFALYVEQSKSQIKIRKIGDLISDDVISLNSDADE